ncbi:MAG: hypothetical protein ACYC8W_10990 [Candidatus Tyrphobacter sp.]
MGGITLYAVRLLRGAAVGAAFLASACGAQGGHAIAAVQVPQGWPSASPSVPTHVQNWMYACASAAQTCVELDNVGIPAAWMAAHVDWNEVYYRDADDATSSQLAAAGARHIVVYTDPNISSYCPIPPGYSLASSDFPENGDNCAGQVARYLHAENGGYAHAYEHQGNGNRLVDHADGLFDGQASEPFAIGDPDLQGAFHTVTLQNRYASDVFEDDGGGSYNCVVDSNGTCTGTFGPAAYAPPGCDDSGGYWCYKYGETAYEWDRASNPQEAYANDAIALVNASAHAVIGNDGLGTDAYDVQWLSASRVEGAMAENAWTQRADPSAWMDRADAILLYHSRGKFVVEEDADASGLMFQIASHWIVYDPVYSIEFLAEANVAPRSVGTNDMTFPEESIVPTDPRSATPLSNDVTAFESAPGLFVREYASCYENGVSIGYCAAVVNATGSPLELAGLTQHYSRVLVRNTSATWAAGGTPVWSNAAPSTIGANAGLILAQ